MDQPDFLSKMTDIAPTRDFCYLGFGIMFLIICNFIFDYDIKDFHNYDNISSVVWVLVLLVFAYFIGRMLNILDNFYFLLWQLASGKDRKRRFKGYSKKILQGEKEDFPENTGEKPIVSQSRKRGSLKNTGEESVFQYEVDSYIGKDSHLNAMFERQVLALVFVQLTIGLLIAIFFITYNYWIIAPLLFFTFLRFDKYEYYHACRLEIARIIHKENTR